MQCASEWRCIADWVSCTVDLESVIIQVRVSRSVKELRCGGNCPVIEFDEDDFKFALEQPLDPEHGEQHHQACDDDATGAASVASAEHGGGGARSAAASAVAPVRASSRIAARTSERDRFTREIEVSSVDGLEYSRVVVTKKKRTGV